MDDRDVWLGIKFREVGLINLHRRITIGSCGKTEGTVEFTAQATGGAPVRADD